MLGNHIIAGTSKGYINILETESRKVIHSTKLSSGLISLLRLTTNGRQLLVNSTDRIIRVVDIPDLSLITPSSALEAQSSNPDPSNPPSPETLPENISLHTAHKFQDLVNRLRWNDASFSHSLTTGTADYISASTYMKKDIYIWELRTASLLRILENREEPAIIEWHPSKPLLACTSIETGSIQIWGIEPQQKWSALAPDFTEVTENVEYVEREDEFDVYPDREMERRRQDAEDEDVDVLNIERKDAQGLLLPVSLAGTVLRDISTSADGGMGGGGAGLFGLEETFVLPMLYDIEDSEGDDQELIRMGVGTMRKKDVNEGKEYGDDGETVAGPITVAPVERKRRKK